MKWLTDLFRKLFKNKRSQEIDMGQTAKVVTDLQNQIKAAGTRISALVADVATRDGQIRDLTSQRDQARTDVSTLQSQVNAANTTIQTLKANALDAEDLAALNGVPAFLAANPIR